jgi:hypothetical protein
VIVIKEPSALILEYLKNIQDGLDRIENSVDALLIRIDRLQIEMDEVVKQREPKSCPQH